MVLGLFFTEGTCRFHCKYRTRWDHIGDKPEIGKDIVQWGDVT